MINNRICQESFPQILRFSALGEFVGFEPQFCPDPGPWKQTPVSRTEEVPILSCQFGPDVLLFRS